MSGKMGWLVKKRSEDIPNADIRYHYFKRKFCVLTPYQDSGLSPVLSNDIHIPVKYPSENSTLDCQMPTYAIRR